MEQSASHLPSPPLDKPLLPRSFSAIRTEWLSTHEQPSHRFSSPLTDESLFGSPPQEPQPLEEPTSTASDTLDDALASSESVATSQVPEPELLATEGATSEQTLSGIHGTSDPTSNVVRAGEVAMPASAAPSGTIPSNDGEDELVCCSSRFRLILENLL